MRFSRPRKHKIQFKSKWWPFGSSQCRSFQWITESCIWICKNMCLFNSHTKTHTHIYMYVYVYIYIYIYIYIYMYMYIYSCFARPIDSMILVTDHILSYLLYNLLRRTLRYFLFLVGARTRANVKLLNLDHLNWKQKPSVI